MDETAKTATEVEMGEVIALRPMKRSGPDDAAPPASKAADDVFGALNRPPADVSPGVAAGIDRAMVGIGSVSDPAARNVLSAAARVFAGHVAACVADIERKEAEQQRLEEQMAEQIAEAGDLAMLDDDPRVARAMRFNSQEASTPLKTIDLPGNPKPGLFLHDDPFAFDPSKPFVPGPVYHARMEENARHAAYVDQIASGTPSSSGGARSAGRFVGQVISGGLDETDVDQPDRNGPGSVEPPSI